jgi:hypothetical protein
MQFRVKLSRVCIVHTLARALALTLSLTMTACPSQSSDDTTFAKASADGAWTKVGDIQNAVQPTNGFEGYNSLGVGNVQALTEGPDGTLWAIVGVRKAGVVSKVEFIQPTLFRSQGGGAWQNLAFAVEVRNEQESPLQVLPPRADAEGHLVIPVYRENVLSVYRFYGAGFDILATLQQESPSIGAQGVKLYGPVKVAYDTGGVPYTALVDGEPTVPGYQSSQLSLPFQSVRVYRMNQKQWQLVSKRALPLQGGADGNGANSFAFAIRDDGAPLLATLDQESFRVSAWVLEQDQWKLLGAPLRGTDDRIDALRLVSRQNKTALAVRTVHQVSLGAVTGSAKGSAAAYNFFELENGAWKSLPFASTYRPAREAPTMDYDPKGRLWIAENMFEEKVIGDVAGSGIRIRRFERGKWSRVGHPLTGARGGFLALGTTGKAAVAVVGKPSSGTYNENFIFRWDGD